MAWAADSRRAETDGTPLGVTPRLAAIVLNYRTPDATRSALDSLVASDRRVDDLILVDNEAPPQAAASFDGYGPSLSYVPTARNLGFSGGMNVGIRLALARGAARVLLVNSDATVSQDCIGRLERSLASNPDAGIAAPILRSRADPMQVLSRGLRYAPRSGRMRDRAADLNPEAGGETERCEAVEAVSGCVMLVERRVFDAIGLLDEDYFYSFEDLDFCLRAGRAGYASIVAGSAVAYHDVSRSIGPSSPRRLYFAARNHLLMGNRVSPAPTRIAAWARFTSILALNAAHAALARGGSLPARLGAVWAGTRDYLAGRYGDGPVSRSRQDTGG